MCIATRDVMDGMFEAYLEAKIEPDDIPHTSEPVYILGKKYNAIQEISSIRQDIYSRLWFTYRRNFVPIGGDEGPTTDKGWGCMLRCGQMVLAQALVVLHLGRDWLWEPETKDSTYLKILKKFEDKRTAPFSIHQIAMMGISFKKEVGQWFGPNTVAQVLKKLVKYDEWSSIEMYVAMDNMLFIKDIKDLCLQKSEPSGSSSTKYVDSEWKPLLLVVPLRLGLHEVNPIYVNGIKKCFRFSQSLGIIGGKPNLALYFIGCVGDEVICLDPHTTQRAGSVENKETFEQIEMDMSYHCKYATRIHILSMDPSVAMCFFCPTEADFNQLCQRIKDELVDSKKQPLFEILYEQPKHWSHPDSDDAAACGEGAAAAFPAERLYDSDHDFEILN